ncbi:hypothetical protein D3C87_40780 [compost metagenome]
MKPIIYIFALSLCLVSCRKGKKLEHPVSVQFITDDHSAVYPQGHFPLYNPYDWTETPIYPWYADANDSTKIAAEFNSDLTDFLAKNNLFLQSDTAEYTLRIQWMKLSESLNKESYTDSCSADYPTRYVYYSSLQFKATATLYKHGIKIDSWTREANSRETIRDKRDDCNKPKVRRIIRRTYSLVSQVAKELRVRISKKMYELEK